MKAGTWDPNADNVANLDGNITLILDDDMFKDILDNAQKFTLCVGTWGTPDFRVSGIDGSNLNINIVGKSGGSLGHFDGGGDGTSLNFTWSQNAIPEPGSVTLSLLALAGLAARRRRRD